MAFASKYQAEMIGKSIQTSLSNDLNNGTKVGNSPSNGRIQNGTLMRVFKILQEFLFTARDNKTVP
ncbi:hypothetical protein Syun_026412 [Stephania yunnanensis]|uniref:Uncharacterized protein n=1 Tax=Stephania yunnanensis TaxID=152371 RepID=A0AAP0EWB5_9MAGN